MAVQLFVSGAPQSCRCIVEAYIPEGRSHLARAMNKIRNAKYQIGQVVRHRLFPFRGVVFDIDPIFNNTEEWYQSIPAEVRPAKDQPFYHLFAENDETEYIAYVSEQNLLPDDSGEPVRHPQVAEVFVQDGNGGYRPRQSTTTH
jgi:heat shock protein HspQ